MQSIGSDLRDYTIHDITHLDALWDIASEIAGEHYRLTPTEAYVLGGAILLHDAGMCVAAYPQGISEIKRSSRWPSVLRKSCQDPQNPTREEHDSAIHEFLRQEHAARAKDLALELWPDPSGGAPWTLVDDRDLRHKFAQLIGEVAASHWWSCSAVQKNLSRIVPAPPPFPSSWSIDLLKLACILRVSDAAHIDERRAPSFIWALRANAMGKTSKSHWLFQNRLTQPQRRNDALYYCSTSDFKKSEADSWWQALDTLRMIDNELRNTDSILADLRGNEARFAARRIANIESPETATSQLSVSGWIPVDCTIKISNAVGLIHKLGGEALYGYDPLVPIRELIQNAADAIRLRWRVQPGLTQTQKIVLSFEIDNDALVLSVSDNGIGMTQDIITSSLLNFGENGWPEDPCLEDDTSTLPLNTIGKYGIGFFSIFMIGNIVDVISRRYDASLNNTLQLSFKSGLSSRPLLSFADRTQCLSDAGTTVRICVENPRSIMDLMSHSKDFNIDSVCLFIGEMFPTLAYPLIVRIGNEEQIICGKDWATEDAYQLISRCNGVRDIPDKVNKFIGNTRPIFDNNGNIIGRLCIAFSREYKTRTRDEREISGAVVSGGVTSSRLTGIVGVINGEVARAIRDVCIPSSYDEFKFGQWLSEQADLIYAMNLKPRTQAQCASIIRALGGKTGELKICEASIGWLSRSELSQYILERSEIFVVHDAVISSLQMKGDFVIGDNIISVGVGIPGVLQQNSKYMHYRRNSWAEWRGLDVGRFGIFSDKSLKGIILEIISDLWNLDTSVIVRTERVINGRSTYNVRRQIGTDRFGKEAIEHVSIYRQEMSDEFLDHIESEAANHHSAIYDDEDNTDN